VPLGTADRCRAVLGRRAGGLPGGRVRRVAAASPEQISAWRFPGEALPYFDEIASLLYPFQWSYTAEDYLAQLATQSGTRALGPDLADEFLARVRRRLDALGSPRLTATFVGNPAIGVRHLPS
jgi:hypothetical protein